MKLYRIYDPQCGRYKGDGTIFTSVRQMVEELADYHDIDWNGEEEEGFENESMLERYDRKFDNDQARLNDLCDYGEWDVEEYTDGKNILYCDCCQTANMVLDREVDSDDFYMCTMCRDNKKKDGEENKMLNTFLLREVLDCNS